MTRANDKRELRIAGWSLERIGDAAGGALEGVDASERSATPVTGVSTDTRSLKPGELFVALRGENFDGHDFVDDAIAGEASAVVIERGALGDMELSVPRVVVDDTLEALQNLGSAIWQDATQNGLHTINVTGSNGKTTTKEFLAAAWSTKGEVFATPGNLNNHIGLPLTLCAIPEDAEHVILEMGANAEGEIAELVEMAPGDERIITSIGVAHIEGFGSVDGIRRAKSEIARCADASTGLSIPHDERNELPLEEFNGELATFGPAEGADIRVLEMRSSDTSSGAFEVSLEGSFGECVVEMPFPGMHNASNLAASLSTFVTRGESFDPQAVSERMKELRLPGGRWRVERVGDLVFVDDAYNANPTSVRRSFDAFVQTEPPEGVDTSKRVAVVGTMLELGDEASRYHEEVAQYVAESGDVDAVAGFGDYAEQMADAAEASSEAVDAAAFQDSDEAIESLADWLTAHAPAFVFLKASRGAQLERVIEQIKKAKV